MKIFMLGDICFNWVSFLYLNARDLKQRRRTPETRNKLTRENCKSFLLPMQDEDNIKGFGLLDSLRLLEHQTSIAPTPDKVLGEDYEELRRRVLNINTGKKTSVSVTSDSSDTANQVDLNKENNIKALEDPRLLDRMARARTLLAEQDLHLETLPEKEEVVSEFTNAKRQFMSICENLETFYMSQRCKTEDIYLVKGAITKFRSGEIPHGYPSLITVTKTEKKSWKHLEKQITSVANEGQTTVDFIKKLKNDIYVLRRNYEKSFDQILRLYENAVKEKFADNFSDVDTTDSSSEEENEGL